MARHEVYLYSSFEAMPNLIEYFLEFLPKTNQYNELKKTGIKESNLF